MSYDEGVARINPATPCLLIDETIKHEWMHLQQARVYDGRDGAHERYGGHGGAERVADCGAWLLGSDVTPCIDPVWEFNYIGPCDLLDVLKAVWLIARPVTDGQAKQPAEENRTKETSNGR